MAFKANSYQQLSFQDSFSGLTSREQKALEKSWAKVFADLPDKFGKYLKRLYRKAMDRGDDYIFLNAWNEWGEGAYLEPDAKHGMRCLDEIRKICQ